MTSTKQDFSYVLFIKTTPHQLWHALQDPEMTKLYWGRHRNVSDWKVGSTWEHQDYDDSSVIDIVGKVIECEINNKLVLTWALPQNVQDESHHSQVTFELTPFFDSVQFTLTHKDVSQESYQMISIGWAGVLSSLKSLLETGKPLESTTRRWKG